MFAAQKNETYGTEFNLKTANYKLQSEDQVITIAYVGKCTHEKGIY